MYIYWLLVLLNKFTWEIFAISYFLVQFVLFELDGELLNDKYKLKLMSIPNEEKKLPGWVMSWVWHIRAANYRRPCILRMTCSLKSVHKISSICFIFSVLFEVYSGHKYKDDLCTMLTMVKHLYREAFVRPCRENRLALSFLPLNIIIIFEIIKVFVVVHILKCALFPLKVHSRYKVFP